MCNLDIISYWYRRTFTAYATALHNLPPYNSELERNHHIESYVEAYLKKYLKNTKNNRQSSGKILNMIKQGFHKFIESRVVPEWADQRAREHFINLQGIYCGKGWFFYFFYCFKFAVYPGEPNSGEIMFIPVPNLSGAPVLSLRRKSSAQTDAHYLAETALRLRSKANELLKKVALNLEKKDGRLDQERITGSLNEFQKVLEDIRRELPSEGEPFVDPAPTIRFSSEIGYKRVSIRKVVSLEEILSDDDQYEDAKETLSPDEGASRSARKLPETPATSKKVQFADHCGHKLCNILFYEKVQREPRRASYSFEDFERMATGRFLSEFADSSN